MTLCYRRVSPPVRELQPDPAAQMQTTGRRDAALTPVMRALIELEGTRATEGKALSKSSRGSSSKIYTQIHPGASLNTNVSAVL